MYNMDACKRKKPCSVILNSDGIWKKIFADFGMIANAFLLPFSIF